MLESKSFLRFLSVFIYFLLKKENSGTYCSSKQKICVWKSVVSRSHSATSKQLFLSFFNAIDVNVVCI